jgi:DhnA family fructose-bisphosphate aldolase class Ia
VDWARHRRLARLGTREEGYFLLALDHGLSAGAVPGLDNIEAWLSFSETTSWTACVINIGVVARLQQPYSKGLVLQMMAHPSGTSVGSVRVPLASVDDAVRSGADAIAVQLSLDGSHLPSMFRDASHMIHAAQRASIPVLLMIGDAPKAVRPFGTCDKIRIASDLGADLVKVNLHSEADDREQLRRVVESAPPVLLAGGEADGMIDTTIDIAARAAFSGLCIGRHVFQAPDPKTQSSALIERFRRARASFSSQ